MEGETNLCFLCATLSRFGVEILTGLFVTPLLDMLLDNPGLTNASKPGKSIVELRVVNPFKATFPETIRGQFNCS